MATKSFLHNINIKDCDQARKLVVALESATHDKGKEVVLSRPIVDLRGEQAKEFIKHYGEKRI